MSTRAEDQAALARQRLGWGPALQPVAPGEDITLDIAFSAPGADGLRRLSLASGLDALTQDLVAALTTARGTDPFDTDFGFDGINALAEESDPMLLRERIRVAIVQVLRREARVRRIIDVRLAAERTAPREALRTLGVTVQFETIAGETVTTTLGGATANV